MDVRCLFRLAALPVLIFVSLGVNAQDDTGETSSNVTGNGSSSTPSTNASKPLPWKFLASPMGVLDQSNWGIKFENWGKCGDADPNKCKLPSQEVEDLV